MVDVTPYTVPSAGTDIVEITLEETYDVEGVGTDTVVLTGTLIAERAAPLLGHGAHAVDWKTATVTAKFTTLAVSGQSSVFGPVSVTLDSRSSAMAMVSAGKCAAAIPVVVAMPQHSLTLRTAEPVQLRSTVRTVPPIGDESTASVHPVDLVDAKTQRKVGKLNSAKVIWRDLKAQLAVG